MSRPRYLYRPVVFAATVLAVFLILAGGMGLVVTLRGPPAATVRAGPLDAMATQGLGTTALALTGAAGTREFVVEIVRTEMQREIGLMNRHSLGEDRGMLFIFPDEKPRYFWMRNTFVPLDIVYLDAAGRVVSVAADAKPLDETPLASGYPARFVLELNAGTAARMGVGAGSTVTGLPGH